MKRMVCFLSLLFTCIALSGIVSAQESPIKPTAEDSVQSEIQKAVFQFIDPEGSPVPYLYIFDARDALDSPYDDYRLPNGMGNDIFSYG